jgi:lipid-A-disaccharide synthase
MTDHSLMFVAGERSGDVYAGRLAAALLRLHPDIAIFGCGGDALRQGGAQTVVDLHDFAMVGITEVISGLPRAYRAFHTLLREAARRKPMAAVLVDSPSLNMRLGRELKRRGIRVIYFISPQLWAWKKWRIKQLPAIVDKMLCIFDFEEALYRQAGIPVEYVGHPLVEAVHAQWTKEEFISRAGLDPARTTVALLPGSRRIEIAFNLPGMLQAATRISATHAVQFALAVAPNLDARRMQTSIDRHYQGFAPLRLISHATYDCLAYSQCAIVASGTATVEALLLACPMVVVYRVSALSGFFGRFMVNVPFYSMVNLLAGRAVVPELIQDDFRVEKVVAETCRLLDDDAARTAMVQDLKLVSHRLGGGGAIGRAADAIEPFIAAAKPTPATL